MKIDNSIVLITGGASGIGCIMGRMALEKGAKALVIWDINQENLDKVVESHKQVAQKAVLGGGDTTGQEVAKVEGVSVDVSNYEAVGAAYARTVAEVGDVDILINCAGVVTTNKTFDQNSQQDIDRTMVINAIAPMYVARAVLPDMIRRDRGHICNIASAAGLLSNPRMSVYAASKWATMGWSDSVAIELKEMRSHVRVTTLAPYYINTGMFDGVKSRFFPILDAERTSAKILCAIENNTRFKGIPFSFRFTRLMQGLLSMSMVDWLFGQVFGIYHTMDHFTGRKK